MLTKHFIYLKTRHYLFSKEYIIHLQFCVIHLFFYRYLFIILKFIYMCIISNIYLSSKIIHSVPYQIDYIQALTPKYAYNTRKTCKKVYILALCIFKNVLLFFKCSNQSPFNLNLELKRSNMI